MLVVSSQWLKQFFLTIHLILIEISYFMSLIQVNTEIDWQNNH
ncbi:hypothetical protein [Okeania sp. SIO2B3]|nr:hypothetical protein [Okeania sp. SIO2B3]